MTREQLLKRKTTLENQIKLFEDRIVKEKDPEREKLLFARINLIGNSLERVTKLLSR
jgi:hypothetical protein